jgi:hypothetical protein
MMCAVVVTEWIEIPPEGGEIPLMTNVSGFKRSSATYQDPPPISTASKTKVDNYGGCI